MKKNGYYKILVLFGALLLWGACGSKQSGDKGEKHIDHPHKQEATLWTCSMHPQIKKNKPGACPICGMRLIPLEGEHQEEAQGHMPENRLDMGNTLTLAHVQVSKIVRGTAYNTKNFVGEIVPNDQAKEVQVSYLSGRIDKNFITYEGQKVRKGQTLSLMYVPQIIELQQELAVANELRDTQPDIYTALRNKMHVLKFSPKQIKILEETKEPIVNFPVYATVHGTVTKILATQGDQVKVGQPIFEVVDFSKIWVRLDVLERESSGLRLGQTVEVRIPALPGHVFKSVIDYVAPVVDPKLGTIAVRATLDNIKGALKIGMLVDAVVTLSKKSNDVTDIIVPKSAVLWTGKRSVVYVQQDHNKYALREVVLGERTGDNYVILKGLHEGEYVVTNGAFTVDAAAQLAGLPSMVHKKQTNSMEGMSNMKHVHSSNLKLAFAEYNSLTKALYHDNFTEAKKHMLALNNALKDQIANDKALLKTLDKGSKARDIEVIRHVYEGISIWMIAHVREQGLEQKVFIQFCPMAHSNQGARWISVEKEIKNPYFGSKMLHCGSTQDSIMGQMH